MGDEAVGIALDWARYYRYRNVLIIRDCINALHSERGITAKFAIPPRFGIPLLDAASLEDDPTLQEMWAALIANATDPDERQDIKKVFIHILSNVEPVDTIILRYLAKLWERTSSQRGQEIKIEEASATLGISHSEMQASLHNLARLGCLRIEPPEELISTGSSVSSNAPSIRSAEGDYHLTSLATDLLKACKT